MESYEVLTPAPREEAEAAALTWLLPSIDRVVLERLLHGEPGAALLLERPDGERMELRLILENGERWLWLMGPGRLAVRAAALEEALDRADAKRARRRNRQIAALLAGAGLVLLTGLLLWQLIWRP